MESVHSIDTMRGREKTKPKIKTKQKSIDLSLRDEWIIWFENWCRVETLSSIFFHNRQNIVFGVIASTLIAITVIFYQVFLCRIWIDELNLTCFCGIAYVLIVMLRFIIWGSKFSKMEKKQLRLIRAQKMYINHKRILLYNLNKMDDDEKEIKKNEGKIGEYDAICKYLDDVSKHIEDRSLCPKIAGLTLNKAFVNLSITSIFGYVFAWILYRLRQDYIQDTF